MAHYAGAMTSPVQPSPEQPRDDMVPAAPAPDLREQDVAPFVARHLPDLAGTPAELLGVGWDNVAYLLDTGSRRVVVRLCTFESPQAATEATEDHVAILRLVGAHLPGLVGRPVVVDEDAAAFAYEWLAGDRVDSGEARTSLTDEAAVDIGEALAALHAVPVDEALAVTRLHRRTLAARFARAQQAWAGIGTEAPADLRPAVDAFLAAGPVEDGDRQVLCHNDLAAEHLLVDPATGRLAGILDWSEARLADPVADFIGLYRDLGPDTCAKIHDAYWRAGGPVSRDDVDRIRFGARCAVVLDLEYALQSDNPAYLAEVRRVAAHTFA